MGTRSLGALTLDLILRLGGFEKGMDQAARISEKRMRQIEQTAKKIGTGIGVALGLAATGFVAFIKTQTDAIASYQDIAEKIGDTAEAVASLKPAADVSGTSLDTVAAAAIKLTAALSKTDDEGKGVGQALKAIGLEIEAFKKLSPVEQIDAVAKALAGFKEVAGQTAVAVALFEKAGAELLPFLKDLADGSERQKTLTQEQIDAANELQETFAALKGQAGTLAQTLAADIIPVVLEVVKDFSSLIREVKAIGGDDSIKEFAQSAALGFVNVIEFINRTIQTLNALRGSFQVVFNDIRVFSKAAGLLNPLSALTSRGDQFGSLKALLDQREQTQKEANARYEELFNTNFTKVSDSLRKTFDEQKNYVEKVAGLDKPDLNFSGIPEKTEKDAKKAKKAIDEVTASLSALSKEAIDAEHKELFGPLFQDAARTIEATRTPLERFNAEIVRLNKLRDIQANGKPLIDEVTYRRAVVAAQDDLTGLAEKTKEVTDEMTVFWEQAARNMQDAFADFLVDPLKGSFKDILGNFEQLIRQMIAQAAAAQIFKAFASGFTGSGGLLDMILGIGGGLGGGGAPIGKRAAGGPVQPGRTYLVGENGPELFSPNGTGTIIPNGGGMTQNINISIAAPAGTVDRRTMQNTAAEVARAARNASMRNG